MNIKIILNNNKVFSDGTKLDKLTLYNPLKFEKMTLKKVLITVVGLFLVSQTRKLDTHNKDTVKFGYNEQLGTGNFCSL
jgi:hypothetical protein